MKSDFVAPLSAIGNTYIIFFLKLKIFLNLNDSNDLGFCSWLILNACRLVIQPSDFTKPDG